jgi:flagellar biosynthetic protein FliR
MLTLTAAQWNGWLALYLWPFVRVLAFVMVAPPFSDGQIPTRIKVGLALVITLVIAPTLAPPALVEVSSPTGIWITMTQVIIGVALGLCVRLVFAAIGAAGELISIQMGLGFATLFDSAQTESNMVIGRFLTLAAITTFITLDGHLLLLATLHDLFGAFPIAPGLPEAGGWLELARAGVLIFSLGLRLALPVIGILLVVNLALAVLSRATAQLNPFAIGLSATLLAGLVLLSLVFVSLAPLLMEGIQHSLDIGVRALRPALPTE